MRFYFVLIIGFLLFSCSSDKDSTRVYPEDSSSIKLLEEIPVEKSGLNFNNKITEDETTNAISFDGMLQGAGVSVLDANNDGLMDVYFASNMEGDKLYINKGDFRFEDQTVKAGIKNKLWSTGVAVVDINNDGWDDIYVCKFLYDEPERRANVFYINNGDGTFTDKAEELGLANKGYGIMANFLDYDRDGDLDVYIANQPPNSLRGKAALKGKIAYGYTDKLYRNDNGSFTDVTDLAGVKNYSYSLSATTFDFNRDGWTDIYVACDYDEPDFLYINNGDGSFTNVTDKALKHMSNFSMGVDIADINNDGFLDVYVADMVAEDNFRQKTNMSGMNPKRFYALAEAGYHYQYMFNALHLNNGDSSFSEVAQLSGISNTDWSWTPLFIDFDQDGYKDLIVTNGLIKEMRNKDFEIWRKDFFKKKMEEAEKTGNKQLYVNPMEISKRAPSVKISNYVYRNEGNLEFSKQSSNWGFDKPSWSQGAAYADFDNDGDLDIVVNNMNMEAGLYRNMANENRLNNYVNIILEGPQNNRDAINAKVYVYSGSSVQAYEYSPYRGYMSSSQRIAHFGLGASSLVDKIEIVWPDGKTSLVQNIKANQTVSINYSSDGAPYKGYQVYKPVFEKFNTVDIEHNENAFDDFEREILLPYQLSTLGPVVAKADVNGDGREDFFLGSASGEVSRVCILNQDGSFDIHTSGFLQDRRAEDGAAHFFDFDADGDADLYVASGGSEFIPGAREYQDRLYINDGKGNFRKAAALPQSFVSNGAVQSFDYDGDGDLDLFVGGRQLPGKYGKPVDSQLLENNGTAFIDVTDSKASFLRDYGMVTSAICADIDGDGNEELLTAGEWMPVRVYRYSSDGLKDISSEMGFDNTKGWWNVLATADIDHDGDLDILGGNLGLNIKYKASPDKPFKLYVDDFDGNGSNDVYLGYYEGDKCFPVRGRQCSSEQMPFVKKKFKNYNEFGTATVLDVLDGRISESTVVQEAQIFANTVFINNGGIFSAQALPNEAQIAPVYGIAVDDFDGDGKSEAFLAGNMYNREVETTRSDAGKGCLISFDSEGSIKVDRTLATGVSADKDVRDVLSLKSDDYSLLVIANNNDPVQFYRY